MKVHFLYDKFILQLQQTMYFSNISEMIMNLPCIVLLCGCCWLAAHPVNADQTRIADYESALPLFWSQVYARGGKTLYCERNFGARNNSETADGPLAGRNKCQFCLGPFT
jgi:hypothetical protein